MRNNDIEKALTAFTKRFQSLLDLVSQSIPDFTLLGDEFKEPRSRVWVLLLKQGTTLRGVPKLEVENVNPEFMHIIFHEYPSFKNEWLEKRKLAKQDANNDGVSFAIVTYKSAVRMVVYTKKKSDLTPFKGQPPAHPRLLVNLINSTIEPGRVYSHGSFQFKLHYARHGESGPVQG